MCVEAKGWHQMSFLIILNLLSWDKVSDLTLLFDLASLLWAFPVSPCWVLGSKVKHPACLALMWMLWIWSLESHSCVTRFLPLSCVLSPCLFALDEHWLAIPVNINFGGNASDRNGQAAHNAVPRTFLFAPWIGRPRLPVGVGPLFLRSAEPVRLFCLSSEDCYLLSISSLPFRVLQAPTEKLLFSPSLSFICSWQKEHTSALEKVSGRTHAPWWCLVNVRWVDSGHLWGEGPKPPSVLMLKNKNMK